MDKTASVSPNLEDHADFRGLSFQWQLDGRNLCRRHQFSQYDRCPATIELVSAAVGTLSDDLDSWPKRGLLLDGFAYNHISGEKVPTDATRRLEWLHRSERFGRQPYQQLAKVLRAQGDEAEARKVLVAMQDDPRRRAALSWAGQAWAWILKLTINYEYDPLRAVYWIMGFVLLGFLFFGMGYRAGLLTPSDKDAYWDFVRNAATPSYYEHFCATVYSFDMFVPLLIWDKEHAGHLASY